jgi:hypothetical protein
MKQQKVKEQATSQVEEVLVIEINLTRGLVALLVAGMLLAAFLGYLAWGQGEVAASAPQAPLASSTGMRQYYLTEDQYEGDEPGGTDGNGAGVCAAGYHFASMWELLAPSNLKYNTDLGYTRDDSGQGPPSATPGWVRTGNVSSSTSGTVGIDNCDNWSTNDPGGSGTPKGPQARFDSNWDTAGTFPGWVVENNVTGCGSFTRVWCVED